MKYILAVPLMALNIFCYILPFLFAFYVARGFIIMFHGG